MAGNVRLELTTSGFGGDKNHFQNTLKTNKTKPIEPICHLYCTL